MRLIASILALTLTTAVFADPVTEVKNAEVAFAKAFADRDQAKFFAMVANDATFLGGLGTLRGKAAIVERWSRFFTGPEAPFEWGPERVEVTADGKLGLSTGPIYDPKGNHLGDYSSIWKRQSDGSWKVIFDGPGSAPASVGKVDEGFVTADDGVKLYYRKFGEGPVAMIVPLDSVLHDAFRQFADIATIVTYDPRNRGKSPRATNESTSTIEHDVRDLEAVRRELKIEKFVPVGYADVAPIVVMYALDHPDRVTRIVQLSPAPFPVDLTDKLRNVNVPVLTIAPHAGGVEWAKSLPDARFVTVEGTAQESWRDDPVTVFGSIRHFLRGEWPLR